MLIYLCALETDNEKREFLLLYSEYHEVMLRVAKKYFPTDQMALEDAVQNAWLKVIKNFQRILDVPCKKRGAYCVIIVKNECISLLRKGKNDLSFDDLEPLLAEEQDGGHADAIIEVIHHMPETYRAVLEMRFVEECSTREIAQKLGIPETTVSTRIFRGRSLFVLSPLLHIFRQNNLLISRAESNLYSSVLYVLQPSPLSHSLFRL